MKNIKISPYKLKLKTVDSQKKVFDPIRNKYVAFTPEEFVRQNMVMYLLDEKKYRKNLICLEYSLKHLDTTLRCDLVIFNRDVVPRIIIECKAPNVILTQKTIDQAAHYNSKLKVEYLVISNGNNTYCCRIDYVNKTYDYIDEIPGIEIIDP